MNIEIKKWNERSLEGCSAIVDAIFGTGLSRLVGGDAAKAIDCPLAGTPQCPIDERATGADFRT